MSHPPAIGYPAINPRCPHFLHGGDYNPDQWAATPEIWDEDMEHMKACGANAMSVGIFSWSQLEPEEGRFTFDWLDRIMDKLAANRAYAVLATPTAAHPAWMSAAYPEVLRMSADRVRHRHGSRVNYCLTAPAYRERCARIVRAMAERYRAHPALLVWHVHNEYNGECHCPLCQAAFQQWLKRKYGTIDRLNAAWWTGFWGHAYTAWEQIESGDGCVHGLSLDWKRFITDQTLACYLNEADLLRAVTPGVPVTTNTYWFFVNYDPAKWARVVDVIAYDSYPHYHDRPDTADLAATISFHYDFYRALKGGRPFMLMESTPSSVNWAEVMKLKRPGIHKLSSLQAVAHGADTVQYFQWRAGRGAVEKFHGAVLAHDGTRNTRVFREVAEIGRILEKLDPVIGASVRPDVAVVYDKQNEWAIEACAGPRRAKKDYAGTCMDHYRPFWSRGISVDVVDSEAALDGYRLVVAPMLYMIRPGVAERIEAFVRAGGVFVTTYWSGIADENDLCFYGGRPGPLRKLLGLWSEELDVLYDDEANVMRVPGKSGLGLKPRYRAHTFCDLIHAEGAEVMATYGREFYQGRPALTVNRVGKGAAYYQAARGERRFLQDFYDGLVRSLKIAPVLDGRLPEGVTAQRRVRGADEFVFLLNFARQGKTVHTGKAARWQDMLTGAPVKSTLKLEPYGSRILRRR